MGGYRKGSGKGKKGYYRGIWCDSTYELAYLIYCLDHNIDIKRCTETFEYELNGEKHTYHPDFVVEGIITEIKGYDRGDVSAKEMSIGDKEYKLLYENDLMLYFDYVASTYNKRYRKKWNNFYELYDEYKPKYEYICDECGKTFNRYKEIKTEHKFCCRSCSGKYRKKNNKNISKDKISNSLKIYQQKLRNNNFDVVDVMNNLNNLKFDNRGWSERLRIFLGLKTRYGATNWLKTNIPNIYNKIKK